MLRVASEIIVFMEMSKQHGAAKYKVFQAGDQGWQQKMKVCNIRRCLSLATFSVSVSNVVM